MMTVLKWLAIIIVALVALCVGIGLALPTGYELERSVVIDAKPAQVHALVGDLERWEEWTPWRDQDPTIKTTFGDKTTGVGASQTWTDKSGGGRLAFTEAGPDTGIAYVMTFLMGEGDDAEEMPADGAIRYEPAGEGTKVSWSMKGDVTMPVFGGWLAKMLPGQIAPMFDKGLAKLKTKAEAEPMPAAAAPATSSAAAAVDEAAASQPTE